MSKNNLIEYLKSKGYLKMEQDTYSGLTHFTNGCTRVVTSNSSSTPVYQQSGPHQCEKCGCFYEHHSDLLEHVVGCSNTPPQTNVVTSPPEEPSVKSEHSEILDMDSHTVHQYPVDDNGEPLPLALMVNIQQQSEQLHYQQQQQLQYQQQQFQRLQQQQQQLQHLQQMQERNERFSQEHGTGTEYQQHLLQLQQQQLMHLQQLQQQNENIYYHKQQQRSYPVDYNPSRAVTSQLPPFIPQFYQPQPPEIPPPVIPPPTVTPPPTVAPPEHYRRPKTFNCPSCKKWFTSSGHLKRHYNTQLHKKAAALYHGDDVMNLSGGNDSSSSPAPSFSEDSSSRSAIQSPPNYQAGLLEAPTIAALGEIPHGDLQQPLPNNTLNNGQANNNNGEVDSNNGQMVSNNVQTDNNNGQTDSNNGHIDSNNGQINDNNGQVNNPPSLLQQMLLQQGFLSGHPNNTVATITPSSNYIAPSLPDFSQFRLFNSPWPPFNPLQHFNPPPFSTLQPSLGEESSMPEPHWFPRMTELNPAVPGDVHLPTEPQPHLGGERGDHPQWFPTMTPVVDPSPVANQSDNSLEGSGEVTHSPAPSPARQSWFPNSEPSPITNKSDKSRDHTRRGTTTPRQTVSSSTNISKCLDCDKVFNKACYLTQHNKSFHSGEKPFKCATCGKRFVNDYLYQEHLSKHAGEKPFKCEICPKQFNHKTDLRRHMCLHSGDKPFACEMCGKGFIRKDHMLKHFETHQRKLRALHYR